MIGLIIKVGLELYNTNNWVHVCLTFPSFKVDTLPEGNWASDKAWSGPVETQLTH